MTITAEQLDELERKAKASLAANEYDCASWYPAFDIVDALDSYADAHHIAANSPDVTLQLIAIVRAALLVDTAIPDTLYEVQAHRMLRKAIRGEP